MSNTRTIAKNTGWYGVELVIENLLTIITSIAIARYLGPEKMGYIIFVAYLASIVGSLGAVGIPATLQKFMAEYLGLGDRGTARYIFLRMLALQTLLAALSTAGVVLWVLSDASADYRLASVLIALSIFPQMINTIPAMANAAAEDMYRNMPASVISIVVFFLGIVATVVFHWGVLGVGASILTTRSLDFLVRFVPTFRWICSWETRHTYPAGLRNRAFHFAWKSLVNMGLGLIVWDRSEFFLLKHLCADIRQVAFYSVAFSLAGRLLVTATIFGSAAGATIFAQFGRDESKLPRLVASAYRYIAISSIPIHAIFTALAIPVLLLFYGGKYAGAETVVLIAPMLCLAKAFLSPAQNLLQSFEKQHWIIAATSFAGVLDIGLAWKLIPTYGAVGACIANGAAQFAAVALLWGVAIVLFKVKFPWLLTAKIVFISIAAGLTGHLCATRLVPIARATAPAARSLQFWAVNMSAVLACAAVSLAVLLLLFYLFRILQEEDRARLNQIASMLPGPLSVPARTLVSILIRTKLASLTATDATLL